MLSDFFSPIYVQDNNILMFKLFTKGMWQLSPTGDYIDVLNPADNQIAGKVVKATKQHAQEAVEFAYNTFNNTNFDVNTRAEVLVRVSKIIQDHFEEFAMILSLESGKPIADAKIEVKASIELVEYTAWALKLKTENFKDTFQHEFRKTGLVFRKPLGVITAISPFNYPLINPVSKIAPAIAAGNAVIIKPSSDDPIVVYLLARAFEEAGIPQGFLQVLTGSSSDIGDTITSHEYVKMVSFTGSTSIGKSIASKMGMKKMHMELGGKCAALVMEDADVILAAAECVKGAYKFAGQRCDAVSRVLVHEKIYDKFIELAWSKSDEWKMGDPKDENVKVGPVINQKAADTIKTIIDDAVAKGAQLLKGGSIHESYVEPTILKNVTTNMKIAWEETFGPVLAVMKYSDEKEALELINKSEVGLDNCIFTSNLNKALDLSDKIQSGSVTVNAAPSHGIGLIPFGGIKDSGIGFEGIGKSIDEMSTEHVVNIVR